MKHSKQLRNDLVRALAAFSLLAASIVLLWRDNLLLFIVILVEGLAALGLWHDEFLTSFQRIGPHLRQYYRPGSPPSNS